MNLKTFSLEKFLFCWPKKKIVSGFSIGLFSSIFVLVLFVFFSVSFNNVPFLVTPMFQGLNSTWPFRLSSYSIVRNHSSESNASFIGKNGGFLGSSEKGVNFEKSPENLSSYSSIKNHSSESNASLIGKSSEFLGSSEKSHEQVSSDSAIKNYSGESNASLIGKNSDFLGSSTKGVILEKSQVENLLKDVKNASLVDKNSDFSGSSTKGVILEKSQVEDLYKDVKNASLGDKNSDFSGSSTKGVISEKSQVEDLYKDVKNGSVGLEKRIRDKGLVGNVSNVGKNEKVSNELEKGKLVKGEDVGKTRNSSNGLQKGKLINGADIVEVANLAVLEKSNMGKKEKNGTNDVDKNVISEKDNATNSSSSGESVGSIVDGDSRHKKVSFLSGDCDIYHGRWVRDDTKPYYPAGSCPHIDRDFDCYLNGRPDDGFLKWRWQPYDCDIPSLNATDFLERLRGKKLIFVGDSLNRNMWESLVCILRHSILDKKKVYEISGRREFKKKGFYAFRFEDYNCSVDFVSSTFLVRESSYNGSKGHFETLRLDLMDRTTSMYHDADILVFNTGHWWTHEKTSKGEDYYQEGDSLYPSLKVLEAYTKALKTWARWVNTHVDPEKAQVVFRGYSVTHFRGGQWNSGGQCHKESEPIYNDTHLSNYPTKMKALEYVIQEMKTPVIYLNISRISDYRKDAHPSIYRKIYSSERDKRMAEQSQDCSHWCLPGVPDTWNELLYVSLLQSGRGSWKS